MTTDVAYNCPFCHIELFAHPSGECLDQWVASVVMEKISCDEWEPANYGSLGGPAFIKRCHHDDEKCYPKRAIGSLLGQVGGCPQYSTRYRLTEELMQKIWNMNRGTIITRDAILLNAYPAYQPGWKIFEGESFTLKACRAAIWLKITNENLFSTPINQYR